MIANLIFEMMSGSLLFDTPKQLFETLGYANKFSLENSQELLHKYLDKKLSGYLHITDTLKILLKSMLQLNPSLRPDPTDLLSHPLFDNITYVHKQSQWLVKPVLQCLMKTSNVQSSSSSSSSQTAMEEDNSIKSKYLSFKKLIPNMADFIVLNNPDYSSLTLQGTML